MSWYGWSVVLVVVASVWFTLLLASLVLVDRFLCKVRQTDRWCVDDSIELPETCSAGTYDEWGQPVSALRGGESPGWIGEQPRLAG